MKNKEITNHGYKKGDKVWIKPNDCGDLKGVVIGFQVVGNKLPIVKFRMPWGDKRKFKSNAFDLNRVSPLKKGKV